MKKHTVAIRTDGNSSYGLGHVSSCLALAEYLRQYNDINIFFIMTFQEGIAKVRQQGYRVEEIDPNLSEEEMAQEIIEILREQQVDLLITDLLEIKHNFSRELKDIGVKSVSIDILGNLKLQSDIVINRTVIKARHKKYFNNENTNFYVGPEYVILHKQFAGLPPRKIKKEVSKILISFGGGDEFNLSSRVLKIIEDFPEVEATLVLGSAFKGEKELQEVLQKSVRKPRILRDVSNMAELFQQHDLAICAGGSTLYELAVTGTPALIIPMNEHQIENAAAFVEQGSVVSVGLHTTVTDEQIKREIKKIVDDYALRKSMSENGKKSVDGKGGRRVAQIMYDYLSKN